RAILGGVVVGRDVTLDGVYHVPGMIRAGADGRAAVAERRAHLRARIAEFEPVADTLDDAALRAHGLNSKLSELRARAAEAGGLAETRRLLDMARVSKGAASEKLSELDGAASSAEERSAAAEREFESQSEALRDQRMTVNQVDAERLRWRDRIDDLGRRLHTVRQDVIALTHAAEDRTHRLAAADAAADAATESLPALEDAVAGAAPRRDRPDQRPGGRGVPRARGALHEPPAAARGHHRRSRRPGDADREASRGRGDQIRSGLRRRGDELPGVLLAACAGRSRDAA